MNTTQRNAADAAILRELAAKTLGDSAFALNTNDLPGTAKRLRDALGYVERLMQATPGTQPNGFGGYSINAVNAHQPGGEFAGYDMNNPNGEAPAAPGIVGNAGQSRAYSINATNAGQSADEFAGYDINAL